MSRLEPHELSEFVDALLIATHAQVGVMKAKVQLTAVAELANTSPLFSADVRLLKRSPETAIDKGLCSELLLVTAYAHCVKLEEVIAAGVVQLGAAMKAVELLDQAGFGTDGGNDLVTMVERAIEECSGLRGDLVDARRDTAAVIHKLKKMRCSACGTLHEGSESCP